VAAGLAAVTVTSCGPADRSQDSGTGGAVVSDGAGAQPGVGSIADVVSDAVFFGDSLTDAGTSGTRFTTMPGLVWSQILARDLGLSTAPAVDGGPNYAEGGARVTASTDGGPLPVTGQLDRYLSEHRSFSPDQLVTLFIGTNDVLAGNTAGNTAGVDTAAAVTAVSAAADAEVGQVSRILGAGAEHVLVFTVFDLAYTPLFGGAGTAGQEKARALVSAYNDRLLHGLEEQFPGDPRVGVFDTRAFVDGLVGAPGAHGFAHGGSVDACAVPGASSCDNGSLVAPHADQSYIFAGGVHLTTRTNELLAEQVTARVRALWGRESGR
jgi:outer membrane lipase/esterase